MSNRTYNFKHLRLVPAERAQRLGIHAETPVFVSPFIDGKQRCPVCRVCFTPLVYQAGYEVRAQHYHETDGGIYFYLARLPRLYKALAERSGWVLQVEPLGETAISNGPPYRSGRAEAVRCIAMSAWCMCQSWDVEKLVHTRHRGHLISSGQLLLFPGATCQPGSFLPVCDQEALPSPYVPLRFQIRDGTVYFSQQS
jgi:hypothetical protein